jgi:hypothetical protein
MGLSFFISTISGTKISWLSLVLSLPTKRPIANESEGGNREDPLQMKVKKEIGRVEG